MMSADGKRQKCGILVSGTQTTRTMQTPTTIGERKLTVLAALAVVCIGCAPTACAAFDLNGTASATPPATAATITTASALANATTANWSRTGNALWDGLVSECMASPTVACFQKNVYHYLDDTLRPGDVNVTSGFRFVRNRLDATVLRMDEKDVADRGESGGAEADEAGEDEQGRAAGKPTRLGDGN